METRTIKFRPLRVIKKTGKVTVASYMQWRKVRTADYRNFNLIMTDEHKKMAKGDFVYNHKGEPLFFYDYNPADVPVFQWNKLFNLDVIRENNEQYGILWEYEGHVNYFMKGTDCSGVPSFSHFTADHIADHYKDLTAFEPLTVEMVSRWYGWFLWRLNNCSLNAEMNLK